MTAPTQWIKKNMMVYSEELGRPLTDAEIRVRRCLEQLPIPDWYQKYSRPSKILRNSQPFEYRQASWKTYKKSKRRGSPRSSPVKSPIKSESETSRTSTADSGFNEAYRTSRRSPTQSKNPSLSGSPCTSIADEMAMPALNRSSRSPLNVSNSFPRVSRSRRIQNINIVFPKPFPPEPTAAKASPRTVYTMTKNIELRQDGDVSARTADRSDVTHTSFLIADVKPSGVTTRVRVFAGPASSSSECSCSSDEEPPAPARCSPSPDTRFFHSANKSAALERIVQSRRTETGSLVQEIIGELDRSVLSSGRSFTGGGEPLDADQRSFVRSMVSALERSCCYNSEEDEGEDRRSSTGSTDSDLAKSTSISVGSTDDSADERTPTPQSSAEEEEDIYWIPCKLRQMPRTSSQLSMMSKRSSARSSSRASAERQSPGLSPIMWDIPKAWGQTYSAKAGGASRQLFRIDETGVLDSGYSDRSTAASSSTTTMSSRRATGRPSPTSSMASTPTMLEDDSVRETTSFQMARSGPYIFKSFLV